MSICLFVCECGLRILVACTYTMSVESVTISLILFVSHTYTHFSILPNDDQKTGKSFNCDLKAFHTSTCTFARAHISLCYDKCAKRQTQIVQFERRKRKTKSKKLHVIKEKSDEHLIGIKEMCAEPQER